MLMAVIYYNKRKVFAFFAETKKQSMKKLILSLSVLLLVSAVSTRSFAQGPMISVDVIVGNRPPAPNELNLMRAEENRHPNIAKAMHDLEDGLKHLHEAPDDFGGRKAQAEADMHQALVSLRRALYFRLYKDMH
jgi:hypothetical protein